MGRAQFALAARGIGVPSGTGGGGRKEPIVLHMSEFSSIGNLGGRLALPPRWVPDAPQRQGLY